MGYNNNGYQRGGYRPQSTGYNNNGYQRGGYQQQQAKKKSGAKFGCHSEGGHWVSAWKVGKSGFLSIYAREYKGTKETTSQNGKRWMNLFVTIVNKTTLQETKTSALYDVDKKRLYIKEFGLICTDGGRGGYCGRGGYKMNVR